MLEKFKIPHPNSPLSPHAWRIVLSIYGAYVVLCFAIMIFKIASHQYVESIFLVLSMLFGLVVLNYLWTGVAHNFGGQLSYKNHPVNYWFGVLVVLIFGLILMFGAGSGLFLQLHSA